MRLVVFVVAFAIVGNATPASADLYGRSCPVSQMPIGGGVVSVLTASGKRLVVSFTENGQNKVWDSPVHNGDVSPRIALFPTVEVKVVFEDGCWKIHQ